MLPEAAVTAGGAAVVVGTARLVQQRRRRGAVTARLGPGTRPRRLGLGHRATRAGAAALGGALLGGPVLATLAALATALSGVVGQALQRARRRERYDADVVAFLSGFARSLRSGAVVHAALAEAASGTGGALGEDLDQLLGRLERGSTLVDGLRRWADERPRAAVRSAAAALALGHETGGLRAEVVDSVSASVRQRLDARAEARGLATQARASAVVLASAPLVFLVLGVLSGGGATGFLLGTPAGVVCLVVGLLLDLAAFGAMLHLVSGVGR